MGLAFHFFPDGMRLRALLHMLEGMTAAWSMKIIANQRVKDLYFILISKFIPTFYLVNWFLSSSCMSSSR